MKILFIGDIVGKGGRKAIREVIPRIRSEYNCSFCIANGENMAGGAGINKKCIDEILSDGIVDVITLGDHVWDQREFEKQIDCYNRVLRPANLNNKQPGKGYNIYRVPSGGEIAVVNLQGEIFMRGGVYPPFDTVDRILNDIPERINNIFVDFHAEATSEKIAMGYYLNGRVTAVIGTHTHVQTSDYKILSKGTAYITDVGMVGAERSVLGRRVEDVIYKFSTGMPTRLKVVESGRFRVDGVIISYDYRSGRANGIEIFSKFVDI